MWRRSKRRTDCDEGCHYVVDSEGATGAVVVGVAEPASEGRGDERMFVYAGGNSIVSGSPGLAGPSLGPASSCCMILTGRS